MVSNQASGTSINTVQRFLVIFDRLTFLPYPIISVFWGTFEPLLPTLKSNVIHVLTFPLTSNQLSSVLHILEQCANSISLNQKRKIVLSKVSYHYKWVIVYVEQK